MKPHLFFFVGVLAVAASCTSDPVLRDEVDALGNETEGVSKGEYHRAGQPCVVCHQEGGPASDKPFSIAGTVFAQPLRQVGVGGAEVRMTDSDGSKHIAKTNCVGNFYVAPEDWNPKFPILIEVAKGALSRSMRSTVGRDGSCAHCHSMDIKVSDPFSQVGHVYLYGGDEPGLPNGASDCPVDPIKAGTQ